MKLNLITISAAVISIISASLSSYLPASAQNPHSAFGANRHYVAARYKTISSKKTQDIPGLARYPGATVLLSSIKMPYTPGGATYNERYMTSDSPQKVMAYFQYALSSGSWQCQQSGWSVNATDANKNFCRVHVLTQDQSTSAPTTRFIIEYKERAKA